MIGIGDDGVVPDSDTKYGGLQKVLVARTAAIDKISAPAFLFVTTKNRKVGGNRAERGVFWTLTFVHEPGKPDVLGIIGVWLLDKRDVEKYYNLLGILAGDRASRTAWDAISYDGLILDLNWRDLGGFCEAEPLIAVGRQGGAHAGL
jgi:hypothetical protein